MPAHETVRVQLVGQRKIDPEYRPTLKEAIAFGGDHIAVVTGREKVAVTVDSQGQANKPSSSSCG